MNNQIKTKLATKYLYAIFAVIIIFAGIFFILNSKNDPILSAPNIDIDQTKSLSAITDTLILPRKARADFQSIISTIEQEKSFESAMVKDNETTLDNFPEINNDYFTKIMSVLDVLPTDGAKSFCSKLPEYSDLVNARIEETKGKIDTLLDKDLGTSDTLEISVKNKKIRNRELRNSQIETYFSRIESVVATSTMVEFENIHTDILKKLSETRKGTDTATQAMDMGVRDILVVYQKGIDSIFSTFATLISNSLTGAKNDCSAKVPSNVVRLSTYASFTVYRQNFSNLLKKSHYPKDELQRLLYARNEALKSNTALIDTLQKQLQLILSAIPKK